MKRLFEPYDNRTAPPAKKLTAADVQALQKFNDHLAELEIKINSEAKMMRESNEQRLKSPDERFLTCCRMEIELSYHAGEDDPDFNDNSDNCIAASKYVRPDCLDTGENWNVMKDMTHHPFSQHKHCYLFYDLYHHHSLPWHDILRIRHIWTHINVCYGNESRYEHRLV